MSPDALALIAIIGLLTTCFAAIAARSLHSFSRHELEQICQLHEAPEKFAEILKSHETIAFGVEIVVMLLAALSMASGSLWAVHTLIADYAQPWIAFLIIVAVLGL